jgi:hypothetical protein
MRATRCAVGPRAVIPSRRVVEPSSRLRARKPRRCRFQKLYTPTDRPRALLKGAIRRVIASSYDVLASQRGRSRRIYLRPIETPLLTSHNFALTRTVTHEPHEASRDMHEMVKRVEYKADRWMECGVYTQLGILKLFSFPGPQQDPISSDLI